MMEFDIFTIQLMITLTHVVLCVVIYNFSRKNSDIEGLKWCIYASLLLSVEGFVSMFPEIRTAVPINYVLNFIGVLAYVLLMNGIWQFCHVKIQEIYIWAILLSYILFEIMDALLSFNINIRLNVTAAFISLVLLSCMYALNHLNKKSYFLEKLFLQILITAHILVYLSWFIEIEGVIQDNLQYRILSFAAIYVIDAMIIIDLLFLIMARRRYQLFFENNRYKKAQEGISDALSKANMANKSKSIFLTNLSHELRTPLNSILGFSEVLLSDIAGKLSDKQSEFVKSINDSGKSLHKLITGLLNLSNIEAGIVDIDLVDEKPDEIMGWLFPKIKEEMKEKQRRFSIDKLDSDFELREKDVIKVDIKAFNQIMKSLLDNAIKYSQTNSRIRLIHGKTDHDKYRFSIIDEGIGIDKRHFHNVFKPLNRAGFEYQGVDGAGTGLPITKGLTELMDGTIGFKSESYVGSEFWVEFPLY
ncbi:sensor histidine kinase [Pseudemcibacter aquimaris]|uniref:sensor histidine kinase n=1 Tax=Pseudemcibacter aquimaris TaxID=2857064 RepID=UPI0020129B7D|nr:histidine kinase dimerization/phospho-acceptor domain-containing protein [Pseudemcibacter aquimaris]MCC3859821.1 hypothetical protein [Pseudemcibacter aquimaris]WDU60215.1 hypothetical protein KW060_08080 [Pseudemcibacter aquimaris]